MAKQLRIHPPGGIHHVTARGNDRMPIFRCDRDRASMLSLIGEASERHRCRVLAYCLMTNHVHLTLQDHDGELSKALKHINGVYAQRFNLRHGRSGHLFEGRFWNSLLESDSYLATATEYVHRNPVEAGMVTLPEDYRWSSYRAYAGLSKGESFLDQRLVLGLYSNDRKLLRSQTETSRRDSAREAELRKPWPDAVLGSDSFRKRHLEGARRQRTKESPGGEDVSVLDALVVRVAQAFSVDAKSLVVTRRGVRNDARVAAIHLAAVTTALPHPQIASYFSLTASHAVSNISKRCKLTAETDPGLRRLLDTCS